MPVNCLKLGRRDSVGASNSQTSSPNSSIASPRRWAAKVQIKVLNSGLDNDSYWRSDFLSFQKCLTVKISL